MSMIKKTKQYFGQRGDRFWLKASYLMLAVAVVILGITAIVDPPDLYRRRSSAPAVDAEGDNGLSVTEDNGSEEDLSEGEESADLRGATLPTSVLSDGNDQYGSVGGARARSRPSAPSLSSCHREQTFSKNSRLIATRRVLANAK